MPASSLSRELKRFPTDKRDAILAINLTSAFRTTRTALPAVDIEGQELGPDHQRLASDASTANSRCGNRGQIRHN